MIKSLILRTASRYLLPLILLFAVFIFLRGHSAPGGGFVGGLMASAAFALYAIAFGVEETRRLLIVQPQMLIGSGLLLAVSSALIAPLFLQRPFMTAVWGQREFPAVGLLNTPLMFDAGVTLTVLGVVLLIIFTLMDEKVKNNV